MSKHLDTQFEIKSWDEKTHKEFGENAKLSRAIVTQNFSGNIEREGSVEYLMMYTNAASARFV